jgi:hypothetical protein
MIENELLFYYRDADTPMPLRIGGLTVFVGRRNLGTLINNFASDENSIHPKHTSGIPDNNA